MIGCEIECPDCGTLVEWDTCDGVSCCWHCGWLEDRQACECADCVVRAARAEHAMALQRGAA